MTCEYCWGQDLHGCKNCDPEHIEIIESKRLQTSQVLAKMKQIEKDIPMTYVYNPKKEQTFYEQIKESKYLALTE